MALAALSAVGNMPGGDAPDASRVPGRPGKRLVTPLAATRRAWRGKVALWICYWLLGVGGNMSFVALLTATWLLADELRTPLLLALYLASLVWFVFIFAAIWRSAAHYAGRRIWPLLARAGVLVGVVRMAVEAVLISRVL